MTGNSEYGAMTLNLAPDLHPVNVDLNVLEKVMSNLLGNARDAMESVHHQHFDHERQSGPARPTNTFHHTVTR